MSASVHEILRQVFVDACFNALFPPVQCSLVSKPITGQLKYDHLLKRKGGNDSDVLPLKSARRDSISNLKSFGLQIWAADKPNAISFRVAVGRNVNVA